jgi:hypothetical protein
VPESQTRARGAALTAACSSRRSIGRSADRPRCVAQSLLVTWRAGAAAAYSRSRWACPAGGDGGDGGGGASPTSSGGGGDSAGSTGGARR